MSSRLNPILDPISLRKNQGVFIVARTQTLLIVDDDADYLRLAGRFLERLGYNWLTAGNGEQAVDVYRRCRPDAVLMDIVMPVKNGIEAVVIILEEDPQARVIFVSVLDEFPEGAPRQIAEELELKKKPQNIEHLRAILAALEPAAVTSTR